MKISECPVCKSKNIVEAPDNYCIIKVAPPANIFLDKGMPLTVYICKDCGHISLFHVDPSVITIDSKK